jgi:hypothetical protein
MVKVILATFLIIITIIMSVRNGGGLMTLYLNLLTVLGFVLQVVTSNLSDVYNLFKYGSCHSLLFCLISKMQGSSV